MNWPLRVKQVGDAMNGTEKLAAWMIANSFATGHGDTMDDLLAELTWQIEELRNKRRKERDERLL